MEAVEARLQKAKDDEAEWQQRVAACEPMALQQHLAELDWSLQEYARTRVPTPYSKSFYKHLLEKEHVKIQSKP